MLKPEQVPSEAIRKAMHEFGLCMDTDVPLEEAWERIIAAALNAWPKMVQYPLHEIDCTPPKIVLPLPQEASDE